MNLGSISKSRSRAFRIQFKPSSSLPWKCLVSNEAEREALCSKGRGEDLLDPELQIGVHATTGDARPDVGALFLEHRASMYAVAYKLAGPQGHQLAQDAVSEVALSLLKKYPENVENWQAYLVTSVKNRVKDLKTSAYERHEFANSETVYDVEYKDAPPIHADQEPAAVAERKEQAQSVREALEELRKDNPVAAEAFWQVKVLERTSSEVAKDMGVSSSRVRQHVMEARAKLSTALKERWEA